MSRFASFVGFPNWPYAFDGAGHPGWTDVPIARLGSWFWRVKNWRANSDMVYTPPTPTFADPPFPPMSLDNGPLTPTDTLTEDDLRTRTAPNNFTGTGTTGSDPINPGNSWGTSLLFNPFPFASWDSGAIFPKPTLSGAMSVQASTGATSGMTFSIDPSAASGATTTILATIDSIAYSLYIHLPAGSFSGTFLNILPVEFFPYINNAGLALYSTTTGVVIPGQNTKDYDPA